MALAEASWSQSQANAQDLEVVRARVQAAGSSFYWAMRFQPPEKREALFAVYAFCREVDDIADGELNDADKRSELAEWRRKIDAVYEGHAHDALTRALVDAVGGFDLHKDDFLAVIDGMEMDGVGPIRAPSMDDLLLYCDRVACAVGRLCVRIFGEPGDAGKATADHLGLALQLTNILRDIEEDAEMGRLYLPRELLDQAGITSSDPVVVAGDFRLPGVCKALGERALREFELAETAIARCSRKAMRPAIIMMMVYRRTLDDMAASGWTREAAQRDGIGRKIMKLWMAVRYGLF